MSEMRQEETREMERTSVYEQDALSNGQTATTDLAADTATLRQRAFDVLLPQWTEARRDVAEARGDVEGAKGELKHSTEVLGRVERNLEHVASCRLTDCLVCEAIALNGARPSTEAEEPGEAEDEAAEEPADPAERVVETADRLAHGDREGVSEEAVAAWDRLAATGATVHVGSEVPA